MKVFIPYLFLLGLLMSSCGDDDAPVPNDEDPEVIPNVNERAFLTEKDFTSLEIEFLVMSGMAPTDQAKNDLINFLSKRLHKSGGITVTTTGVEAEGKETYSVDDVNKLIDDHSKVELTTQKLTAHILFLDGEYTDGNVLGIAFGTNRMAVFEKFIQNNTGGLGRPKRSLVESTVLQHEFGHTLGLVNVGTPNVSGHEDIEHRGHCNNDACLMYWSVETGDFITNFIGSEVPELDANCVADLQANGGK